MDNKLKFSDFDILGIISLNDVQGIERYVTPVIQNGELQYYLSRSREYYNVKTLTELALERSELSGRLKTDPSKRNFVILEHMLSCSAKVYYKKMEKYILSGRTEGKEEFEQAERCLIEDMQNMIRILQGNELLTPKNLLPAGSENCSKRAIEMDNKAILYLFARALDMNLDNQSTEVLIPGYGSLYIGPILKCMYGYDFTNLLKSKYIRETITSEGRPLESRLSNDRILSQGKNVLLLDDNVGTGTTIQEITEELENNGVRNITSGAVQFNWRNYYRVSIGEKRDIDRFNVENFDILSPINYAGHKLYEHAIDWLHSSGEEYINYLQGKGYRKENKCDLYGALYRGLLCARASGLELQSGFDIVGDEIKIDSAVLEEYSHGPTTISNPITRQIINRLVNTIANIGKDNPLIHE